MKIAVVHNLPTGGQKRALYEQVKRLSQSHRLDLFTLSSTNEKFLPLTPFCQNHFTSRYNPPPHFPQSAYSLYFELPDAYRGLAQIINSGNYDVAYINPCFLTQAPYLLRYLKIPSLYYCPEPKREFYEMIPHVTNRITYLVTYPFRYPIKKIDQINTKFASRIITNSSYSNKRIESVYGKKAFVNYLGIDTELFKPSRIKKENIVLSVGEISLHKGHDFIIKAISQISQNNRPKLVIIGHGGIEKEYLINLTNNAGVEISVISQITDAELVEWYNKAKVFVSAAMNEPFGLVLLEAASCGLPIVAVDEGGIKEVLSEDIIGTLTTRNEKEFSQAIMKHFDDLPGKKELENQINFIRKNWNWEKSVFELEKHLKEVST